MKRPLTIWCLVAASLVGVVAWADLVLVLKAQSGAAPLLTQPGVVWIENAAGTGVIDFTPTVVSGSDLTFDILDTPDAIKKQLPGTLTEESNFDTSTGRLTGSVGSGYGNGMYTIRATSPGFVSVVDTPNLYYDIAVCWHKYTSTGTISNTGSTQSLDTAGRLYSLTENITSPSRGITVNAAGIGIKGDGYKISYNQADSVKPANWSFETVDAVTATLAESWDFNNAPNAIRWQGSYPLSEVRTGDYSLKFVDTTSDEYVESEGTITLAANTTYSLTALMESRAGFSGNEGPTIGVIGYIELVGTGGESTVRMEAGGTYRTTTGAGTTTTMQASTWSGAQVGWYVLWTSGANAGRRVKITSANGAELTFTPALDNATAEGDDYWVGNWNKGMMYVLATHTTGVVDETYKVRAGIEGSTGADDDKPYYIDDVAIQRYQDYGVYNYRKANVTIGGCDIDQGNADVGTWSHGIFVDLSDNFHVVGNDVTVTGDDTCAVFGSAQNTVASHTGIVGNTVVSNVTEISNRNSFHGACLFFLYGTFAHNNISGAPHACLTASGSSRIFRNTTSQLATYTNPWSLLGGAGSVITDNTVLNGSGTNTGHGISCPGGSEAVPSVIRNNTIAVRMLPDLNQEYGGASPGGAFGVQIDESAGTGASGTQYYEVIGNDITAYGTTTAYCARFTSAEQTIVRGNTLRAVASEGGHASPFSIITTDPSQLTIEDNHFITNDGIALDCGDTLNLKFYRTRFTVETPITSEIPFRPGFNPDGGDSIDVSLFFVDTIFSDAAARQYFEAAWNSAGTLASSRWQDTRVEWTTTINVRDGSNQPIVGATVTVDDVTTAQAFTGTTDSNGQVIAELSEFGIRGQEGAAYTNYNDHSYSVVASGYVTATGTITATQAQTINVEMTAE